MRRQITDSEVAQTGLDSLKASMYVSMGGSVVSYDPKTRTANVQPMQNDPRTDLDTGATIWEPWDVLQGVPVLWPRFGGGTGKASFILAGMLNPNDQIILRAFDLDPSTWIDQGRSSQGVNPSHIRRLGGNHWTINPADIVSPAVGLSSTTPEPGTNCLFLIGPDGSSQQVRFNVDGSISIGGDQTDGYVALAAAVSTELGKIASALSHLTAPVGGGLCTGNTYTTPGSVAATIAKAK